MPHSISPASRRLALPVLMACMLLAAMGCSNVKRETITYYAPQPGPSVRVTNSAGPANEAVIEIAQHELRLMVVAQPSYDDAPRIWVNIHLPEGKRLRIEGHQFLVTPADGTPPQTLPIRYIRGTHVQDGELIYRDYQPGQDLLGASTPTYTRFWGKPTTFKRQYEIVAPLGHTLPEAFTLQLPAITLDDKPLNLPTLTFHRQTGDFEIPDNSMHPW